MTLSPTDLTMIQSDLNISKTQHLLSNSKTSPSFSKQMDQVIHQKETFEAKEARLSTSEKQHLHKVANEVEAIFVNMMLKTMRQTLHPEKNLLYGGNSEEIFQDMMYEKIGLQTAEIHDFGIAKPIYKDLVMRA